MTDTVVLEARLEEAETALHELMTGKSSVSIEYDGYKTAFKVTDQGKLQGYIHGLKCQLGLVTPRRAMRVTF